METFDLIVIGGGPGGYVCAIRAAQLGLNVAIVEREHLGGTCLNKGCIPTKSLLQSSKVKHFIDRSEEFGVGSSKESVNLEKIVQRSRDIILGLNKGVFGLISKNKIKLFEGTAKFKDKNTLTVDNSLEIKSKNIVIATGASPRIIPGLPEDLFKKGLIWTSKEAISPTVLPKDLLIVGSGAIGIELASFYKSIGTNVTVVEIQDRILVMEDSEISDSAQRALSKKGIKFLLKTKSQSFKEEKGRLSVELVNDTGDIDTQIFDAAILAIGVVPNTGSLNLDNVGVKLKPNGSIEVNKHQMSNIDGIFAIGDVANAPWLAHKASREGIIVAEKVAGLKEITPINLSTIPSCTYSNPQIASIGMTEEKALADGHSIKIGRSHFRGNGKALATGESDGFVKIIFDGKTGELLGAHMIGYEVTELISIFSVAIAGELTEKELMAAVFPHPTMSECIQEAVYAAFGMAIHG